MSTKALTRGKLKRAQQLLNDRQPGEAREACIRLLKIDKLNVPAWEIQGKAAFQLMDYDESELCFRHALDLSPKNVDNWVSLGMALRAQGRFDDAADSYRTALGLAPDQAHIHNNLGNCLFGLQRYEDAIACYRAALAIVPSYADALSNMGNVLHVLGRYDEALACLLRSADLNPASPQTETNLGNVLQATGRLAEAETRFRRALSLRLDFPSAAWNLAMLLLFTGRFPEGWAFYERRRDMNIESRKPQWTLWQGEALKDKSILVYGEQGVGDEIMFASCLPELVAREARVTVYCDPRLRGVFARSFDLTAVHGLAPQDELPDIGTSPPMDFCVPMGSLMRYLRPDLASFPRRRSFLQAERARSEKWRERFQAWPRDVLRVGVSWAGGREEEVRRRRTIPLLDWQPILNTPNVRFVDLQHGEHGEELAAAQAELGITLETWEDVDPMRDMEEFFALISQLDLVIAVDNSTVHVAGSLGVDVWPLLPFMPDWRWFEHREDSPWYPAARLFRQAAPGEWTPVIAHVANELARMSVAFRREPI